MQCRPLNKPKEEKMVQRMPERIIVDTDIGSDVDDAYALAFLAKSPEVKIEAVTTVWADPLLRARIARKLLDLLGKRDIPVAAGEANPLNPQRPVFLFGHEGRGVLNEDGDEDLSVLDIPAGDLIESLLRKYPQEIKVVLIGPQTNMGKLLSTKPELAGLVKEFVIMGGLPFYGPKEIDLFGERPVDFNMISDPEAAATILACGIPTTMVGVNVTVPTLLTKEDIQRVRKSRDPAIRFLSTMTDEWISFMGIEETSMHDALAASTAFTLEFLDTMMLSLAVETKGELTTGLTVVNRSSHSAWNRVRVATDARRESFVRFMLERVLA
jgi:purine nucleosidase